MDEHLKWKTLSSEYLSHETWFTVRKDTCERNDGTIVNNYYVFEFPEWATAFPITAEGKIIMTKQYRHALGEVGIELPGGCVDKTDASFEDAIKRELLEETGYGGSQFFCVGQSFPNTGSQNNTLWSFLAVGVVKLQGQQLDEAEHIEIVLQDFTDFNRDIWGGAIPLQSLHLATIGLASHFIKQSKLPELEALRRALQQR